MFWFIFVVIAILLVFISLKNDEEGLAVFFSFCATVITVIIIFIGCSWFVIETEFKMMPTIVANKRAKINEMRYSYFAQPKTDVNIDLVNQNLVISLNDQIIEYEKLINNYNMKLALWRTHSKYWWWYPCFNRVGDIKALDY